MFYNFEEEENNKLFQKIKDNFFDSFKEKMPHFNKGMWYLYVLELEYKKIYVGITNNPRKRIRNHFFGRGAVITEKFIPIKVLDIIECRPTREEVEQVENDVTENLFDKYGYENVFGGKYCNKKWLDLIRN